MMTLPTLQSSVTRRAGFLGSQVPAIRPRGRTVVNQRSLTTRATSSGPVSPVDQPWRQPFVLVAGFLGWTVPSTIPVPAFGGESLFGQFLGSIGEELAHFPKGPALGDRFWLLLVTYHVGLFVTLFLGQIGYNGRKQGYW